MRSHHLVMMPAICYRDERMNQKRREEFRNIKDPEGLMKELTIKLEETTPAKQYQCPECGLHYENEETANKCAAWCSEHNSCNLEITKSSVEAKQQK